MRKAAFASVCVAAMALPAAASAADIEVYGQAHLAASYLDNDEDYSAFNLSSNASRLGFRAGHDFLPNLRGLIQIEGQVDFDSNDSDYEVNSRDTFAGLTGDWGLLRVGRFDTPMKILRTRVDFFGNQLGDARNAIGGNSPGARSGFDSRFKNGIAYRTPSINGFTGEIHYSPETDSGSNAADSNDNDAWSASVTFRQGDLYAAAAYERWSFAEDEFEDGDGNTQQFEYDSREAFRLAAYYDLGPVRLAGLYQQAQDPDDDAYGFGVRWSLDSQWALKAQYYALDADDSDYDTNLIALGVDYQVVPELRLYLNYARISNDDEQGREPWTTASTLSGTGEVGHDPQGVALGMIYNF